MQLQELVKNALIDAGLGDYAIDTVDAAMLRQGIVMAEQSVNALNNDPALSFGLITIELEGAKDRNIYFPLMESGERGIATENGNGFAASESKEVLLEERRNEVE
jgi:hypothetical protein